MKRKEPILHPADLVPERPNHTLITDPFGSYTGHPLEQNEKPVQDADDL